MNNQLRATVIAVGLLASGLPGAVVEASPVPKPRVVKAKAVTKVSGMAGTRTYIDITRPTSLGNGGADSPTKVSSGRWGGVLLVRADDGFEHMETDWYAHYRFEEKTVCPGEVCMDSLATHSVMGGTAEGTSYALTPGRYAVVLLGDDGSRVQTTLKLKGLPRGTAAATARSRAELTSGFQESVGADGHHAVSRGYSGGDRPGPRFDALGIALSGATPAVGNSTQCVTYSSEPGLAPSGAACLGGGGQPGLPAVAVDTESTLYGFDFFMTPAKSGYVTLGWDAEMVSSDSRIVVLKFSVVF